MDSKHIFGGVIAAFLFGFVVLYSTKKNLVQLMFGDKRSCAGVAGSALAYALAKAGGCMKLAELGLEDCLDGSDSQTVFSFAAVDKDGKRKAFTMAASFKKLREKAASLPNVNLEQGTVTSLVEEKMAASKSKGENPALYLDFAEKDIVESPTTIEVPSYSVGLVLEDYDLPYANRANFILKDTIAIAYPISSNEIRCLVDVPGPKPPSISTGEMASYLKTVVAPQMPPELYNAFICAIDKGNIRTMPNRIMPASSYPTPGAFLIGDSLNMRHSVTGGGMTVGLSDVVLLRDLLRPLNDLSNAASIYKYLESFCVLRKPTAFAINTLASTLHTVFSSSDQDPARKEMKEAFFNYLSLGGVLLLPFPTPKRMCIAARLVLVGSGIIFPILKAEGIRATFFPATMPAYYRTPPLQSTGHRETGK
ncbi:hypothetical protein OIU85_003760 [Salix viminalis]|uniref:Squalene monooxygenase n=1 Tax=Salix viminalis TaxID=40686 RepID=A0A9Q0PZS5_SALVM|nr:hypothetical protein OIU85_003760 [Salix viminalis]